MKTRPCMCYGVPPNCVFRQPVPVLLVYDFPVSRILWYDLLRRKLFIDLDDSTAAVIQESVHCKLCGSSLLDKRAPSPPVSVCLNQTMISSKELRTGVSFVTKLMKTPQFKQTLRHVIQNVLRMNPKYMTQDFLLEGSSCGRLTERQVFCQGNEKKNQSNFLKNFL